VKPDITCSRHSSSLLVKPEGQSDGKNNWPKGLILATGTTDKHSERVDISELQWREFIYSSVTESRKSVFCFWQIISQSVKAKYGVTQPCGKWVPEYGMCGSHRTITWGKNHCSIVACLRPVFVSLLQYILSMIKSYWNFPWRKLSAKIWPWGWLRL
jgi:hypothetical protein